MKKVVIGILPQCNLKFDENPFNNKYVVINTYSKKLMELGSIPIALLMNDGKLNEEALDLCDAFLLPGGRRIENTHFQILEYAITNNKPVLGICCGMQAMAVYSMIKQKLAQENKIDIRLDDIYNKFVQLKQEKYIFLNKIEKADVHGEYVVNNDFVPSLENIDKFTHDIKIDKSSILYDIYKKENVKVTSLHRHAVFEYGDLFKVTATSYDGIIESLELNDKKCFILGVQFHPELMDDNLVIKRFVEEVEKRKNNT